MGKVTGLGGVFIKFKDPENMRSWYREKLGLITNDYGVLFEFNGNTSEKKGHLQLGTFKDDSDYFGSPEQQVMLNFRVENMEGLVSRLKDLNVRMLNEMETYSYGKFIHIEDPEGNKIELWEPVEEDFESSDATMPML